MKGRGLAFAALLATCLAAAAAAQDASGLKPELARLLDSGRIDELRATMAAAGRPAEMSAAAQWSRESLMSGQAGGAVALSYAELLGRLGEWEEQRRWFAYAVLALEADAARCAAEDRVRGRRKSLEAAMGEAMADFRSYPEEARRLAAEQAEAMEAEIRPRRRPDLWLCGGRVVAAEDWRRALGPAVEKAKATLLR